jgi:hypothetical protein
VKNCHDNNALAARKAVDLAMAVTFEGYRVHIVEQLKAARGTERARDLLAEVDMVLASARLSTAAQGAFWESLNSDLDVLAEESKGVLEKEAAAALSAVIAAAQGAVLKYRRLLESAETKSTD